MIAVTQTVSSKLPAVCTYISRTQISSSGEGPSRNLFACNLLSCPQLSVLSVSPATAWHYYGSAMSDIALHSKVYSVWNAGVDCATATAQQAQPVQGLLCFFALPQPVITFCVCRSIQPAGSAAHQFATKVPYLYGTGCTVCRPTLRLVLSQYSTVLSSDLRSIKLAAAN